MDPVALISGIGLGAIGAKLLDIFWLQDKVNRQQHTQWLRDKRLEAFSDVTKEFITFGLHGKEIRGPFESYGAISKALLLIDDEGLVERIDQFVVKMERMNRLTDEKKQVEAQTLYEQLTGEARAITGTLRSMLLHEKVRG